MTNDPQLSNRPQAAETAVDSRPAYGMDDSIPASRSSAGGRGLLTRMSDLVSKTQKQGPAEEPSLNAQLLARAGYVQKLMGGVYIFLPLGKRVLDKIEGIIRREMDAIGGQEVLLPALHPKENWLKTGRWDDFDALYKLTAKSGTEFALGPTHEEVVTPMLGTMVESFRDLPVSVYQLQTKFRNELRAKAGLMRGREFRMKDMYSFHATQGDLDLFYKRVDGAYWKIFEAVGIADKTYFTYASGGSFSKYSHEYQTVCENGEDTIYVHPTERIAVNKEVLTSPDIESEIGIRTEDLKPVKAIETANIFKLGTRFSSAFDISFVSSGGQREHVIMGCYGLGPTRLMGTIVELHHDPKGIVWPEAIAPYRVHFVSVGRNEAARAEADKIVQRLTASGVDVLYDDREGPSAGEKFKDAELLGIPVIMTIGDKSFQREEIEIARRGDGQKPRSLPLSAVESFL